jgi:uncharacterized protein YbjT (DUF2867 family)
MSKTALVIGATGLTGSNLVNILLKDPTIRTIKIFGRKTIGILHTKIEEHLVDLLNPTSFENDFTGDVAFCCIGTTAKKTPDKDLYRKIDYGIPVAIAELCKKNNIPHFITISALGANKNSSVFYNRTKGEMEEAILASPIEQLNILRPSLIVGDRKEFRLGEKIASGVMKIAQLFMIGSLRKYRPIQALQIAQAMAYLSNHPTKAIIIESDEIKILSESFNTNKCIRS